MKKKARSDLENFRKLFRETGLEVTESFDEHDFTEFLVGDSENSVEFYFDTEGKFVGINKVTNK